MQKIFNQAATRPKLQSLNSLKLASQVENPLFTARDQLPNALDGSKARGLICFTTVSVSKLPETLLFSELFIADIEIG